MTCRDIERMLDRFLDGELEARAMRTVALHVTRCEPCEAALQQQERLQDVVVETFADAVAEVEFTRFWPGVASRIGPIRARWWSRPGMFGDAMLRPLVAAGAVAVAAVVAFVVWRGGLASAVDAPPPVNNQVRIDSLRSDARSVALLSEPRSNTTVIWVVDEGATP